MLARTLCILLLAAALPSCDKSKSDASTKAETSSKKTEKSFGAGVKIAQATSIDAILANPKEWNGKTVRVDGMITDVCPKRGCWMEIAGDKPGQKLKFKVTDGEMVFPMDAKGQRASAEGVIAVKELSIEESKEYAKYQAEEYGKPYDEASITQPMVIARIDGTGAVIYQ